MEKWIEEIRKRPRHILSFYENRLLEYVEDLELRLKSLGEMHDTLIGEFNRRGELIEKQREALEYYADPLNFDDCGQRAKQALALTMEDGEK